MTDSETIPSQVDLPGVRITFEPGYLCMIVRADATVDSVIAAYEALLADSRFSVGMNSVWDLSGFDLRRIALGEIRRLATELRRFVPARGSGFRAALVSSRRVDFHLLRTYLAVLRLIGRIQLRAFDGVAAAGAWACEGTPEAG